MSDSTERGNGELDDVVAQLREARDAIDRAVELMAEMAKRRRVNGPDAEVTELRPRLRPDGGGDRG